MRKIAEFERKTKAGDEVRAVVYYHSDWQDYFVRFFKNGFHLRKMFYPADDREDAISRAQWWIWKDE